MTSSSNRRPPRSGVRLPLWALILLAVMILVLIGGSSVWLFQTVRSLASDWEATSPEFGTVTEPVPDAAVTIDNPVDNGLDDSQPFISTEALKPWSGTDRISILLLGIDLRCNEEGPTHTDTMIVLTIDPVGLSAAMLSLPRDLWVEIPGFGVDRINQAHYLGQVYEYPGGGPALAVETVEATLGVTLDYYAAVNFQAFIDLVDQIGGITIDVPELIDDPDYPDNCYGFDPLYLAPDQYDMNGEMALKYARTRSTLGGDVDRAGRQQQVILAVRDQVVSLNKLPQLIAQAPQLWQSFQNNVRTNMSPDEALQLALLVQEIPEGSIQSAVINYDYVYAETTSDGRQVLVPNREKIRQLRDILFKPAAVPTPVIENLATLMANEKARVVVYNGTAVFGLAAATQEHLARFNVNVVDIGNADSSTYRTTQIIEFGEFPATTQYLVQLMEIPPLNISRGTSPDGPYDVLIILGDDWRIPGS